MQSEMKIPETAHKPDVIIIGAGPCGLWTAIQIKLQHPQANITIFEKYQEYQRHHVLSIHKSSYDGAIEDKSMGALTKELTGYVPTSVIETKLLAKAKELGIKVVNRKIENCEKLVEEFPSCKVIIGADGARSQVRKFICNDEMAFQENLNNIVELKYQIKGRGTALPLGKYISTMAMLHHSIFEYVGKEKNGVTSVSLRFFVNNATFQAMEEARGAHYFHLQDPRIPDNLKQSMTIWLNARKKATGEEILPNQERITVANLDVYCSKKATKHHNGVEYAIVGDAYCGLPYFRSLNNGLIGGTQLAKSVAAYLDKRKLEIVNHSIDSSFISKVKIVDPMSYYEQYVKGNANSEYRIAKAKNYGVKVVNLSVQKMQFSYAVSSKSVESTEESLSSSSPCILM